VPYDNDVAMSEPMFVEEPGRWVLIKGASHDKTNAAYPFEVDGEPFIPSAAVRIARGEPRKFVVFVQNATPDEMTMHTTPATTILSQLRSTTGSKLVFKLDAAANASTLSVTMRKNGSTDERSVSVPLLQP
jgi:hypothetical protein